MISLVVPIYNEISLLDELVKRCVDALESTGSDFELILVDDGSYDGSLDRMIEWSVKDSRLVIVELSRNFGHQAAYTAGLEQAKGDYVAMMDGDLQDPPELIPEMFLKIKDDNVDVVNAQRTSRKESLKRQWVTRLFHSIFNSTSGLGKMENSGNFSMLNRSALKALLSLEERTRYLPGLRSFIGFKQVSVEYDRDARFAGEAKMNVRRLIRLAADAVFSFSKIPLKFCLYLGIIGICISMGAGIYILLSKALGIAPLGWSSTMTSIFFLGSIQLTFLGVLGEYVFRIYRETQQRPNYFIRKVHQKQ
ncbi:glycosyltransferase [Prolixibacteraceae bacterium JC049]|nr:glycosyltransferase [Prolixibacteraceae bacterium JC049]